ncbi:hypothetical protein [Streptomyces sp. NPDC001833]|uniref:hypothetical protein n=1 Tax=Streptomyces sp. NPDC001833 TaxID=3154658 RepID=UPI003316899D
MTNAKKIFVTIAIAVAAVGGTSVSAFANSHATVVTPDNSHATVVTPDNSHATVVTPDNSHATGVSE